MKRRSMKRVSVKKENKTFKTLAVATIAGLSFIGVGQAQATTLDEVDLSQKPIDTPILDYLHDNNVQIKYEDGTEVAIPQSSYAMTNVEANSDGSKPTGDNIITQYDYDKTTGSLSPLYYEINYQTQFGNPDGDTTLTFGRVEYQQYGYTNYKWELNPENPTRTITYKYNQGDAIDGSITNDSTSANIARDFVNTDGTLILNNENATISNITGNFIANKNTDGSTGNYLGNGQYDYIGGKLIDNKGHIDNIKGNFAINEAKYGLIYNNKNATINKIEGLFVDNSGYAVSNRGIIKSILADFIKTGGINNDGGTITNIVGDFIKSSIYNDDGTINNIKGNFIESKISNLGGSIDKIEGTFTNGKGSNSYYSYSNAMLNNSGLIKLILADFIANQGGGIANIYGGITDIIGTFVDNGVQRTGDYAESSAFGGAIYNEESYYDPMYGERFSFIDNITATFSHNGMVVAKNGNAQGGAIFNGGTINSITDSFFYNNYVESKNGAA